MKIALVNLSKIEDFAKTEYYQDSLDFLTENQIDFVDCFSGRENLDELLAGFHEALRNNEVELVWFIQGGNTLIKFLNKIDWDLVKQSDKEYLGSSDFTHFVFKAVELGKICYYGPQLKEIKKYFPTPTDRQFVIDFLKRKQLPDLKARLLHGTGNFDLASEKIIGGHSFVSTIMLGNTKIDLENRFLFFEHHYRPGEKLNDVEYFLESIKYQTHQNLPKGFILGHSMLFDKEGKLIDVDLINEQLVKNLVELGRSVYYLDHFKTIIKLS